ncbi:MAG: hypothetical protein K0R28_4472 [Paenibacillus sp.]|jgi:hypothetical protein|nr:hypothetical protein [Paenibacillus sp.]
MFHGATMLREPDLGPLFRESGREVIMMAGRNNRPKNNGPAGHPSHIEQYREEFAIDLTSKEQDGEQAGKKDKTRFTM